MTSQVYYRKWRPQQLSELVGQEPIVRTLQQALIRGRIAHAYLFTGSRGTGKTSTARILAKAVNCLEPRDGEPCNSCHLCIAVNEGRALDLIEIDAASNRGIDEIRSIKEKVIFSPAEGKYKVYILDEAHMLTDAAADALLKTLEEPPAHVIFILATTEPHRLPSTIVSRCQRFDFRRITPPAIVERLEQICTAESIEAEPAALHLIARNSGGSLRDAENLLDQAVTSFGTPLGADQARLLMGLTTEERVRDLVGQVLTSETSRALVALNAIAAEGLNLQQLHRQMVNELRDLLLIKSDAREMVAQPDEVASEQVALIARVPMDRLVRTLRLMAQVTFRHDAPAALPLELAIIESDQPAPAAVAEQATAPTPAIRHEAPRPRQPVRQPAPAANVPLPRPASPVASPSVPTPADPSPDEPPAYEPVPQRAAASVPSPTPNVATPPAAAPATASAEPGTEERLEQEWEGIVRSLSRFKGKRFNLGALLRACPQRRLDGDTLELGFTHRSHMERMKEELDNPDSNRTFQETIKTALGNTTPLKLVFAASNGSDARNRNAQSPMVQVALGMGGKILEETEDDHE